MTIIKMLWESLTLFSLVVSTVIINDGVITCLEPYFFKGFWMELMCRICLSITIGWSMGSIWWKLQGKDE